MKKLISLMLLLMLVYSCSKYPIDEGSPIPKSTSNGSATQLSGTPQLKVWFFSIPDRTAPVLNISSTRNGNLSIASAGWIDGHSTHIKMVDPSNSYFRFTSYTYNPESNQVTFTLAGTITSENRKGDSFIYSGSIIVDLETSTYTGAMLIENGTGMFESASGTLTIDGTLNFKAGELVLSGSGPFPYPNSHEL